MVYHYKTDSCSKSRCNVIIIILSSVEKSLFIYNVATFVMYCHPSFNKITLRKILVFETARLFSTESIWDVSMSLICNICLTR